jgi:hypothetical protein
MYTVKTRKKKKEKKRNQRQETACQYVPQWSRTFLCVPMYTVKKKDKKTETLTSEDGVSICAAVRAKNR